MPRKKDVAIERLFGVGKGNERKGDVRQRIRKVANEVLGAEELDSSVVMGRGVREPGGRGLVAKWLSAPSMMLLSVVLVFEGL